jgi:hypothetical protein
VGFRWRGCMSGWKCEQVVFDAAAQRYKRLAAETD